MLTWDPTVYGRFDAERARASNDLAARINCAAPHRVVDLGCGSGLSTLALAQRYPDAEILGVDHSGEMLAAARRRLPHAQFLQADIAQFRDPRTDLLFANAALHWVPRHIDVMARLMRELPAGGCLAAQMPDNEQEPSHALMREIASRPAFGDVLAAAAAQRSPLGAFADYDAALAPWCAELDIWRTVYVHRFASSDAIVAFVEGAGLKPFLEPLAPAARAEFLTQYREAIARAYPAQPWGGVLFAMPRLFIVATRKAD